MMQSRRVGLFTGLTYQVLEWSEAPADAQTVLLLHGFLDFAQGWAAMVDAGLRQKYRVIAPDLRGHGDSDRVGPGGYYYFFDYLADVEGLRVALGLERFALVGHSMGGSIAGYYAGTYPDRVSKLVLMEGTGPPQQDPPGPARVQRWIHTWKAASVKSTKGYASVEEAAARLIAHDRRLDRNLALTLAQHGTRVGPDGTRSFKHDPLHVTPGPFGFDPAIAMRFWNKVTCPVLLIEGGESEHRHGAEERTRRHQAFADHQELLIPGAGHMMQRHRPRELAAAIEGFLG